MSPQYPGYILRQTLITFCQEKGKAIAAEQNKIAEDMDTKNLDPVSERTLDEAYAANLGRLLALRDVTEWAKDHLVPPPDSLANGAPIDDPHDLSKVSE